MAHIIEQLDKELKSWIKLDTKEEQASLAKHLMAMRNYDGGEVLIGFDNKTSSSISPPDWLDDIQSYYSQDKIQLIASNHANPRFEVTVAYKDNSYVIIQISGGIEQPTYSTKEIKDSKQKFILKKDSLYTRTLDSNGTASSSEANHKDIAEITKKCERNKAKIYGDNTKWGSVVLELQSTPVILKSKNLTSVTDNGTGDFTLTFADELPRHFVHDVKFRDRKVNYKIESIKGHSLNLKFEEEPPFVLIEILSNF